MPPLTGNAVNVMLAPAQAGFALGITVRLTGSNGLMVTINIVAALDPQTFSAATVTFPAVLFAVTFNVVVPCPL